MKKQIELLWQEIVKRGLPLIVEERDVRLFISDFWDMDKMNTVVTTTLNKVPIARMKLSKAILNMLLYSVLDKYDMIPKEKKEIQGLLFTGSGNVDSQREYSERIKNIAFNEKGYDIHKVSYLIGHIKEAFVQFSWVIDSKLLMDISMIDIFELCDADEKLKDWILNGPIKRDDMSLYEVETVKKECLTYIAKVIDEQDIQPLKSLLAAGTGVRLAQFVDCLIMIGTRPDKDVVIPNIVKESWLRGISTVDSFYYESYISRIATIMTKLDIRDPGSFQKYISYLNNSNHLNEDENYMCDSVNYVVYDILNQSILDKVHDRYMIIGEDVTNLKVIDKNKDKDLIGQTIKVRSPLTCNSISGICRYCSGENIYKDNVRGPLDSKSNLGVILTKRYISPIGQDFLSAKHNMVTNIEDVVFIHDTPVTVEIKNIDVIKTNGEIIISEEYKIADNTYHGFEVSLDGIRYEVLSDNELFVDENNILHVTYKNKRKSKAYTDLKELFGSPNKFENPIAELNKIVGADYIVGEMLMRNLVFMKEDTKKKPDYSKKISSEDITFVSLKTGIINNTGIVNKLCYGQFNDIMLDPNNYVPVPEMNYDILYADRSNFDEIRKAYREKYEKEINNDK